MDIVPFPSWAHRALPSLATIDTPTPHVVVHHGAAGTSSLATLRQYERHHRLTNGWATLGYNFAIAEGKVWAGRGAGRQGAHAQGRNRDTHGIVVVGDYSSREPSDRDLHALVALLRHGADRGWWMPSLLGHRDVGTSSCPGETLYRLLPEIRRRAFNPPPEPAPEPSWLEDIMAAGQQELADIAAALDRDAKARERQADATRAHAAAQIAEHVAKVRQQYGLPEDPHSDGIWGDRVASGSRTLAEVGSSLRDAGQDG